ncbi:MAG: hypothetical protein OHK0037_27750 [Elainellaceae cyanobacterium]
MLTQQNKTQIQIQQAIQQIEGALAKLSEGIAHIRPAALYPDQALEAWEDLEPMQQALEAALNRFEDLLIALVDRMEG